MTNGEGAAANMNRKYNLENNATIEKLFIRSMNEFYLDNSFCVKTIALYNGREVRPNSKTKVRQESIYITQKRKSPALPTVATVGS